MKTLNELSNEMFIARALQYSTVQYGGPLKFVGVVFLENLQIVKNHEF